jgi:acyl-coenzyme A synthetase/AMP-(fatty) acid ligase
VPASHGGLIHNFASFQEVAGYTAQDIILPVPKLYFGYGRTASIIHPFRVGAAAIVFPERFTPEHLFALMNEHQPTVLALVPTAIKKMLTLPKASRPRFERLRLCLSGGEALSESLCSAWHDAFGCEVLNTLGSTEMGFVFIANRPDDCVRGSVGKPLRGYEAKIVDARGNELPDGEEGLLMSKGPSSAQMYWHERSKSQQTFRGEWVCTGDRFRKDDDGNFWFAGRNDELVKISGNWVSPVEVEECLLDYIDIRDCAVIAATDDDGTTQLRAWVVLAAGVQAGERLSREIRSFVKSRLAPYKAPRIIEYVPDLPTTATGKMDKRRLVRAATANHSWRP